MTQFIALRAELPPVGRPHRLRHAFALWLILNGLPAQAQPIPLPVARPMAFDVAGLKLGMSSTEARAVMARSGYRVSATSTTKSFDQKVRAETDSRLGRPMRFPPETGTYSISGRGPHEEFLQADFVQVPGSSIIGRISVTIPPTAITNAAFRNQISNKYGAADVRRFDGAEQSWCAPETHDLCGSLVTRNGINDDSYPKLAISSYGDGGRIVLDIGNAFEGLADKAKFAAVDKLAPRNGNAAF